MLRIEPLEDRRLLAAVIGIDFGGPGHGIAANQTAGVVPRANWNNVASGQAGAVYDLVNDANAQTTADISWTANNTWQISAAAPADGNAAIYKGYLDTTEFSTTTVNVAQIPFALYDVYVYFDGDTALGRSGKYTIDTSTLAPITQGEYLDNANWPIAAGSGAFALADAPGEAGNYALFRNLSGESFALTATPFGGPNPRAPVNAIQIVERPLVVDTNTNIDDGNYGTGQLSLREAIALANARPEADTITFAGSMSGQTILLGGSQLTITRAVTIDAAPLAQNVTINAQQQSRIFDLTTTSGDVTLAGLTLTGGRTTDGVADGGAIRSQSSDLLTLRESTVSGNSTTGSHASGGGIRTLGSVTLIESTVSNNSTTGAYASGGGIRASGSVTLTESTVSGNSTMGTFDRGGGIVASNVTLTDSTVSGNSSNRFGGGIHAYQTVTLTDSTVSGNSSNGSGGGIYASNVTLTKSTVSGNSTAGVSSHGGGIRGINVTLTHSTVSGNTSGGDGGGVFAQNAATIIQSTITSNHSVGAGGGLSQRNFGSGYPATISGSIIAGNTAAGGNPDLRPDSNSAVIVNYSLIGVANGLTFTGNVGNLTGTTASPLNPQLGPLADNGGPTTTHALLPGSPAIDAGDPAINSGVDQRGFARVEDSDGNGSVRIDIGAYELSSPLMVVDTNTDIDDGNYGAGQLSLREAIALANARPGSDTITFAGSMSGQTILLGGSQLEITGAVTIDAAPLAQNVTVNAQQQSRIFNLTSISGDVTLVGLTLTGGRTTGNAHHGGAIRSQSSGLLTLRESTVSGNSTTGDNAWGGGIFASGSVTLAQSTVSNNSTMGAFADGGGIRTLGSATLTESTVSGNTSGGGGDGGGIRAYNVTLTQSTVSGNSSNAGGGIYAINVTLTQSTVSGNSTTGFGSHGGGISAFDQVTLTQSTVSGNSSGFNGGGIWADRVTLTQSTITNNHSVGAGGGLYQYNSFSNLPVTISGSIIAGNTSAGGSADLRPDPDSVVTVNYSLIGTSVIPTSGANNISTDNPLLGPLGNNGGPTQTHALLPGSPAIDAGPPPGPAAIPGLFNTGVNAAGSLLADNQSDPHYQLIVQPGSGLTDRAVAPDPAWVAANSTSRWISVAADRLGPVGDYTYRTTFDLTGFDPATATLSGMLASDNTGMGITLNGVTTLHVASNFGDFLPFTFNVGASFVAGINTLDFKLNNGGEAANPTGLRVDGLTGTVNWSVDQRGTGFARVADGDGNGSVLVDIGAYEVPAPLVVDTNTNIDDGNYGAGQFSLREAIALANARPGADTITFAAGMSGQTILLGGSQLTITGAVTIDAAPLAQNVTINAQQQSRIFNITATTGDFTLAGLTLTGGRTTGDVDFGGAIRSFSFGLLTLRESNVSGNSTTGAYSDGGGIYASGNVTLTDSTISGNSSGGAGGGIRASGSVTLTESTVSGNSTMGNFAFGGGISATNVTLTQSTVSGNSSRGIGGGIYAINVTLTQSTVSGNSSGTGGGIFAFNVTLTQSTVSGNSSGVIGGGIYAAYVTLTQSTITNNHSVGPGGGLCQPNRFSNAPVTISGSIIAGNTSAGGSPDLRPDPDSIVTVNDSLIGTSVIPTIGANNIATNNPLLGPLGNNGGPTQTHALLPGSPAIDAVGLLDSFSSNRFATHYNFVDAFSSADNNPQVSGGAAHLNVGTGTGAFIWNQGQKLSAVGDRVSVDFRFNYPIASPEFALSSAGLALFGSVSGDMLAELRVETDKVNGNSTLRLSSGIGETPLTGTPSGLMTLSVVVTGSTPTARTVQYTLSGNGIGNITGSRTFNTTEIYFGPVAFNVSGSGSVHDNLVFAAAGGAVFDQRGLPRPVNGGNGLRPDIGAYESQGVPSFPDGDYNHDGIASAADYVLWRDNPTGFGGTPTGYNTWRQNFGNTTVPVTPPGSGAGSELSGATGSASAESAAIPSDFTPTTFTSSSSRRSSSVPLNQTPSASNDKRMLLAFDQALEELDEERTDSRWLADADDAEEEIESELALAAVLSDWQ